MIRITIYRRWTLHGKQWFWRATSRQNGKIMAVGGEGFYNLNDVEESVGKVRSFLPLAELEIVQ